MRLSTARTRRLEQLEAELARAPAEHQPIIALRAAGEVLSASGVSPLDRDAAVARVVARLPADRRQRLELAETIADLIAEDLATPERRASLRTAVETLARDLRDCLPGLAAELERALEEPVRDDDPAADVVWVAAVVHSFGRE